METDPPHGDDSGAPLVAALETMGYPAREGGGALGGGARPRGKGRSRRAGPGTGRDSGPSPAGRPQYCWVLIEQHFAHDDQ